MSEERREAHPEEPAEGADEDVSPSGAEKASEGGRDAAGSAEEGSSEHPRNPPKEPMRMCRRAVPSTPIPAVSRGSILIVRTTEGGDLTLYESTQGPRPVRATVAPIFGLDPERVRVVAPYVGGGFGSKGLPHANTILAALVVRMVEGRPVKFALTRQQMFSCVGYRTPTIQRIRLGVDRDGHLTAISHDVVEQTAKIKEFAEQTAYGTRTMYATENRRTTHRLAALDVSVPS